MSNATVYGLIHTSDGSESQFAIIDDLPQAKGLSNVDAANVSRGDPTSKVYPKDIRLTISKRYPGKELSDFVSNTNNMLIVSKRVKEVIEEVNKAKTEYIAAPIYHHNGKLASNDYFLINPLGTFDVLDINKSEIEWEDKKGGDVVHVEKMVLDPKKLKKAPDLFRPKESKYQYIISKNIAGVIRLFKPKLTNLHYLDIFEL